jgi:hypothetical protein
MDKIGEVRPLSEFGECAMALSKKHGLRTQAALRRALHVSGYKVKDRTLASYLYGRVVVDPALPVHLASALRLNKKERRELADAYTFGQPPRRPELSEAGQNTSNPTGGEQERGVAPKVSDRVRCTPALGERLAMKTIGGVTNT